MAAPLVDLTGRTLAYRSSRLRSATMGEEYPSTLVLGELCAWMVWMVRSFIHSSIRVLGEGGWGVRT